MSVKPGGAVTLSLGFLMALIDGLLRRLGQVLVFELWVQAIVRRAGRNECDPAINAQ